MVKRLIVLALLAAGVWWLWTHRHPALDYRQLSGHLEGAVNQELAESGISDKDVLQNFRQERSHGGATWIESDRCFQAKPKSWSKLLDRLTAAVKKQGGSVLKRKVSASEAILELGQGSFLMQRIRLLPLGSASLQKALPETPEVAFVIDDVAYDFEPMDRFAALGVPLTFAILPRDKNSKALAEKAVKLNFPVILHLPMEPLDLAHNNPGKAGLYLSMTTEQLRQQFDKDVDSVPHIQGINNHMGSAFTEDSARMNLVLQWVKERNLFFLDSHTTQHSVVPKVAKVVGIPCLVNETFLDNEDSVAGIEHQLDLALKLALKHRRTIAIGHYRRKHLVEAFARKLPDFQAQGVTLVTLPSLYPKH